jgi:hypothetical protein
VCHDWLALEKRAKSNLYHPIGFGHAFVLAQMLDP